MTDDNLAEYVNAKSEFEKARGEIKQTADAISDIVNALKNSPERVRPSGAAIPIVSETKHHFNADEWPNGERINELLIKMHTAYSISPFAFCNMFYALTPFRVYDNLSRVAPSPILGTGYQKSSTQRLPDDLSMGFPQVPAALKIEHMRSDYQICIDSSHNYRS